MYQHLIQVNPTYYMILADRFKSYFAIQNGKRWTVSSIDLQELFPEERILATHINKGEAIQHIQKATKNWIQDRRAIYRRLVV